jgi:hypothetical protein
MQPLDDDKLQQALAQWNVPGAPASLEVRLRAGRARRGWRWFLHGRIEMPVPLGVLALAAVVVLGIFALRGVPARSFGPVPETSQFQIVDDLNPRIIESSYAND